MGETALQKVKLRDGSGALEATFVPAAGMLCCSLRHRGSELLAQNAGVDAYAERGKTMGIPLLYPWANRLSEPRYSTAGMTVEVPEDPALIARDPNGLPIHGVIGGRIGWERQAASGAGASSLRTRLRWSERLGEPFAVFPFEHELEYDARLDDGRLQVIVTVTAGGGEVPVAFGFHPYLAPPGAPRERWLVELPAMRHLALDGFQIPLGSGDRQPAESFELAGRQFDDGYDEVAADAVFAVEAAGRRIELELLEGYTCAQVYAPGSGEFMCFEPMTAPTDALHSGSGLRLLRPGERHRAAFAVSIRDLR